MALPNSYSFLRWFELVVMAWPFGRYWLLFAKLRLPPNQVTGAFCRSMILATRTVVVLCFEES